MLRRCLRCRALTDNGSYCAGCKSAMSPWPASPGRANSTTRKRQREAAAAKQGGWHCAWCGARDVKLELHHLDHDHTNDAPANHGLACLACHRQLGRRKLV